MIDQKEIENRLRCLPIEASLAFGARCALRVLPGLARSEQNVEQIEAFWFWEPDARAPYLLHMLMACNVSSMWMCGKEIASITAVNSSRSQAIAAIEATDPAMGCIIATVATVAAAAAATDVDAGYAAGHDAAYGTAYACHVAIAAARAVICGVVTACTPSTVDNADGYGGYISSTAYVSYYADSANKHYLVNEISNDLHLLINDGLSASEFLQQPLWAGEIPNDWQRQIVAFKTDVLSLNSGFDDWLAWYDDRCSGKPLDVEFLVKSTQIPSAIHAQGIPEINSYLANLRNRLAVKPLNRVRAIFIGYGDAGKTSVIRALHGETVRNAEPMTPGIEIRMWSVPNSDIKAHFWDFGGQVMVHATHQLFLRESCLYVVVISARNEINATEQAEYWLQHVLAFGKNAPVIIVGNKSDIVQLNLEMATLRQKYQNIVSFHQISCTEAQGTFKSQFDLFRKEFCQQLQAVGTHQMLFTQAQSGVLDSIRQLTLTNTFLSQEQYNALCDEHGVAETGVQNHAWLLDILDKLGVIIHFPELPFSDGYVLNPRWLTYGVYKLMYSGQARLTKKEVVTILRAEKVVDEDGNVLDYPREKCGLIMEAMKQFKLCYSLPNQADVLIMPALLPAEAPTFTFNKTDALAFSFEFKGFLPRHVLPELIVMQHEDIQDELVWQNGVVLASQTLSARALLQVDYHLRTLSIWVYGSEARDHLTLLRSEIKKILARLSIAPHELITLTATTRTKSGRRLPQIDEQADYLQIQEHEREQQPRFISASGATYDVGKILQRFMPDAERPQHITQLIYGPNNNDFSNKAINMSSQTIHNSGTMGNVINAGIVKESFNQLAASPATDEVKQHLLSLIKEIDALHKKVSETQGATVKDMLDDAQALIVETARPAPRKTRLNVSLEGILDAAQKVGSIGQSVLSAAKLLGPMLNDYK